ncbi:MAG: hypothetical protein U5N26_05505 [Candidatus Marinimicrobia bacterium]|nr:hypothetical protein [Candidatus Neomarinimicrobiota bacterium]
MDAQRRPFDPESFGIGSFGELPKSYRRFFKSTPYYLKEGNVIFVHAGLNTQIDNPFEDTQAMLWKRGPSENSLPGGKRIVHGHTPVDLETIHKQLNTQTVNIDNGLCLPAHSGPGKPGGAGCGGEPPDHGQKPGLDPAATPQQEPVNIPCKRGRGGEGTVLC